MNEHTKKEKQVQIDKQLFMDCLILIYGEVEDVDRWERAAKGVKDKFDKMINHELYSKYLTAETAEEREQARQKYLDKVGIPKDFRWSEGYNPDKDKE